MIERAGGDVDVARHVADVSQHRCDLRRVPRAAAKGTLRFARGAAGVDHGRTAAGGLRDLGLGPRGVRNRDIGIDHPRRHVAVEDQEVLDLGQRATDAFEHGRELRVDVHDRRIAVIGDVRRFLVAEPIVQRHRSDPDLARCIDQHNNSGRVLAAPHDLGVAGAGAELHQHVGQAVGLFVELPVRHGGDGSVGVVVDHGQLAGLRDRVCGEEVSHQRTS